MSLVALLVVFSPVLLVLAALGWVALADWRDRRDFETCTDPERWHGWM